MITADVVSNLSARLRGYDLRRVSPVLWRVVDGQGIVVGHLAELNDAGGVRYSARRYHAGVGAFLEVGSFWALGDALAALHDSR
ncbi:MULTISPECIES: hypothetical protein [unclassified Microbacterium]|uniref:hypothetical protein n=1 Tax=unclassified Microbacterium TaxID=2609290 RepID=UPI003870EA08